MANLRRTARYVDDLSAIWEYIAQDSADAADNMVRRIESRVQLLSTFPDLGERQPVFGEFVRRVIIGSYLVFYETSGDAVLILRAIHGSRRIENLNR